MIWKYLVLIDNHTKSRSTLLKGKMTISMSHSHLEGGGFVGHIFGNQKPQIFQKPLDAENPKHAQHNVIHQKIQEETPTQLLTSSSHHVRSTVIVLQNTSHIHTHTHYQYVD